MLAPPPRNTYIQKYNYLGYWVIQAEPGHGQASLSEAAASVQIWSSEN